MSDFEIADLAVGGGRLALCPLAGRSGNYRADMRQIANWAPDLVLSMTQTPEMQTNGAADFGEDLLRAGVAWQQLAIADFGVPGKEVLAAWPDVRDQVQEILAREGRVLVHCLGGCGRSGMVVLRLMVELGEPMDQALARLRAARPCAVETAEQMDWARGAGG